MVAAIDLAIFYRCDPFTFLERSAREVMQIYKLTKERVAQVARESD